MAGGTVVVVVAVVVCVVVVGLAVVVCVVVCCWVVVTVVGLTTVVVVDLPHEARAAATAAVTGIRKAFVFFLKRGEPEGGHPDLRPSANLTAAAMVRQGPTRARTGSSLAA